jgi:hypothetical protein
MMANLRDDKETRNWRKESKTIEVNTETSTAIPGLKPVDVYLNLEEAGFVTEKLLVTTCTNGHVNTKLRVLIIG